MRKIIFTSEQTEQIIDLYVNEMLSMAKIGERFGVSKTVIRRILDENQITIKQDNHVYKADYRKFQNIDTPEKAYWLGFFAADGNVQVREDRATVRLNIHQKDREHLELLRDFMNSNVRIVDYINDTGFSSESPTPMCQISFNSVQMAQDFIDHGVVPKKSLILEPPKIDSEFYLPYIMGYFDGDGTIYKTNHNTEFTIGFIGSKATIEWINEVIGLNAKLEQRYKDSQTYHIRCGGTKKPYEILKPIYDSTEVHLKRKFELFKELENVVLSRNTK